MPDIAPAEVVGDTFAAAIDSAFQEAVDSALRAIQVNT